MLIFQLSKQDVPEAYELLIFDAMRGDSTFFAHWNEVELSWKWVQPILEAFEENTIPLPFISIRFNGTGSFPSIIGRGWI